MAGVLEGSIAGDSIDEDWNKFQLPNLGGGSAGDAAAGSGGKPGAKSKAKSSKGKGKRGAEHQHEAPSKVAKPR